MRVFCPEHGKSFFAPRQNPIKCGNRDHILGELDFEGQALPPSEIRWQYCCNCEHFCLVPRQGSERCPACARQVSALYLCDRCYVATFESNTPAKTKNFLLTSEWLPQPSCPGCLRPASTDLREHSCDEFGASFVTALTTCPFCAERLDIGPAFPASVAYYLKRTKSGNKLHVTFDYENELFVPVEDGEFVLIRNGSDTSAQMVLPRSTRFKAKREFYDFYEDYFHCANPAAGEVQVIEPLTVEPAADGWKFKSAGIIEVIEDQPRKIAPPVESPRPPAEKPQPNDAVAPPARQSEAPIQPSGTAPGKASKAQAAAAKPETTPCPHCGSEVETQYAFCWHCGDRLAPEDESSTMWPEEAAAIKKSKADAPAVKEPGVKPGRSTTPLMISAPFDRERSSRRRGTAPKVLLGIGVIGALVFSLGLFAGWRALSSAPGEQFVKAQAQLNSPAAPEPAAADAAPAPRQTENSDPTPQEAELKKLRQTRLGTGSAPQPAVIRAFSQAERRYPSDYRFAYERAKLVVQADRAGVNDEAFVVLSRAAAKAIDNGKADEMLSQLETDKHGDFNRLARGRVEWKRIQLALRKRDKAMLVKTA